MTPTQTSVAPLGENEFWIRYSNLLLSYWSVPSIKAELKVNPAQVLQYFELATVPGANFDFRDEIDESKGDFNAQYKMFKDGHTSGDYVIYLPSSYPESYLSNASDVALMAESTSNCCCCSCCPCCSCF